MGNEFQKVITKPKFLYLWVSQILSQVTVNIMNFLLLAHLYTATKSSIATSLLWVAYALPSVVFGPVGAATVDLFSRRKMLMVTNLLQSLTIFSYIFINQQSIFILYAVVLTYSLLNQFYVPAESAYLPSTIPPQNFTQANSLFFMTSQASLVLGFGFAGLLQRVISFNGVLIICSIFLFIAFVSTSFLEEVKPRKEIPEKFEKGLKIFFDSIIEGYEFIKNNKTVLYPLLLLLGIQASLAIIVVSLPVIAMQILNISVNYSGVSIVVPAGIGATLGSVYIPRLVKKGVRKKTIIEDSLIAIVISTIALCFGIPYLPLIYRVLITPLLIVIAGLGFIGVNIPTVTFLQSTTPDWLRGRVFGNLYFLITIVTVFPVLFSGAITEIFGIRTMLTILGLGAFGVFLYSRKNGDVMIKEEFK